VAGSQTIRSQSVAGSKCFSGKEHFHSAAGWRRGSKSEDADNMEKLLVIITVSLVISIVGLKIAEVYEYEDYKRHGRNKIKKLGARVPICVLKN